jgi:hypothetical protein
MPGQVLNLNWSPPGPVAAAFMEANKRVQVINGPVGSGKTTACFMKAIMKGAAQQRSTRDGIRKFKLCVVRDTYRQLWKTTLQSWFKRIPRNVGEFTGAENSPATHKIQFQLADKSIVDLHIDFIAVGENAAEDVMRGYEPTVWYLNESDLLAREVFIYAKSRWGRYPDMEEGGPTWHGIIMDCNAPELTSWLYQEIFRVVPDDVDLFRQPGGNDPGAENLPNLVPGYYRDMAKGAPLWFVQRMINNIPGYSRAGKPVYPEFNDHLHVAKTSLVAAPWRKLILGLDGGLSPAAAFLQRMPNGQWWCLDELVTEPGTGPIRFGELLAQRLIERYPGFSIEAYGDPSTVYGNDKDAGEKSWLEIVAAGTGIIILPAPTNALIPRLEAVRKPLMRLIDGGPAFLLDPSNCPMIREGFNSGYRYKKLPLVDLERYSEEPDKTPHSHPHDALQYGMSAGGEDEEIRQRSDSGWQIQRMPQQHVHDWDPFNLPS